MASGTYAPRSEFGREFFNKGEAKGLAEGEAKGEVLGERRALLTVLRTREFALPDDLMARITECIDPDQLNTWTTRAVTAPTLDDIFTEN